MLNNDQYHSVDGDDWHGPVKNDPAKYECFNTNGENEPIEVEVATGRMKCDWHKGIPERNVDWGNPWSRPRVFG